MIVKAIFELIRLIFRALSALLPAWTPFDLEQFIAAIETKGAALFGLFRWMDWYFPVSEAMTLLTLGLSLFVAAMLYRGAKFLLRSIHVMGG